MQFADNTACGGRVYRGVRHCLVSANGRPVLMRQLLEHCYPASQRHPKWHYFNVWRCLHRYAVPIDRLNDRPGRPIVWAPNAELRRLIG